MAPDTAKPPTAVCRNPCAAAHLLQTQQTIPGSCPDSPPAPGPGGWSHMALDAPGCRIQHSTARSGPAPPGLLPLPSPQCCRAAATMTGSNAATKTSKTHQKVNVPWESLQGGCSPTMRVI